MKRGVCARRTIAGRPFALQERLVHNTPRLLQQASGREVQPPDGDGWFLVDLSAHVAGSVKERTVRVRLGQAAPYPLGLRIPLRWVAADAQALFPTFEGAIEIEDADVNRLTVALVGSYEPPGGLVGAALDRTVLATAAEESVERLLTGLVQELSDTAQEPEIDPTVVEQLSVADVMTPNPFLLDASMSLRTGANLLLQQQISGAPVVDPEGHIVGVLSESDLLDKVAPIRYGLTQDTVKSWRNHAATTVGMACSRPAHTTQSSTPLRDAAKVMAAKRIRRLVVMEGGALVGILTKRDVVKALLRADAELAAAVDAVLHDSRFKGLRGQVADGVVHVTGVTHRRSRLVELEERLDTIDGVIGVITSDVASNLDDLGSVGRSDQESDTPASMR
ncbi:CBS domain-containing protein [Euzebya tangerina]|uniref:CBS domain-containing protein n=1 Tax=Euzebya tangerina TaxID=591198 RepID=UPI000E31BB43|nr:CBS domain-containing protein [Euzebya tangerina]